MHRIDGPGATADQKFTDGDPASAIPATTVTDDWLNDLQENVCRLIEDAGIALAKGNSAQLKDAIAEMIADSSADMLNTTRINVASASTVNLTTAAPDTRHINITGTVTINVFTVTVGKCYFVRFNDSLTLPNNGSIVTNRGANITVRPGDTCILRATAANTVEVLFFTAAANGTASLAANGYQRMDSGLIIQWGTANRPATSPADVQTAITFPIAFPVACRSLSGMAVSSTTAEANQAITAGSVTDSGFTLFFDAWSPTTTDGNATARWIAIGH